MDRLIAYMKEHGALVDETLKGFLPRRAELPSVLHEAMRYSVFAGGKRLRPLLCLLGGRVGGAAAETCLPAGCAIEMIHTYSLIHDDLPAMDDDDYRRGKLSCHKAFGEAVGILAGDALLTLAFQTIATETPPDKAPELAALLARAAGHAGMIAGQVLDLEAEGAATAPEPETKKKSKRRAAAESDAEQETPLERVEAIHERKTGALITVALEMGAVLGEVAPEPRAALRRYGGRIGLAFQIQDDILDIESSPERLGKSVGKDAAAGKLTYPTVLGLDRAKALLREAIIDAKKALESFGEEALFLRLLADYIAERDH